MLCVSFEIVARAVDGTPLSLAYVAERRGKSAHVYTTLDAQSRRCEQLLAAQKFWQLVTRITVVLVSSSHRLGRQLEPSLNQICCLSAVAFLDGSH